MMRTAGTFLAATLFAAAPIADARQEAVTAEAVANALEAAYGVHPGMRRNHAKGTCALGSFVGTPEAR